MDQNNLYCKTARFNSSQITVIYSVWFQTVSMKSTWPAVNSLFNWVLSSQPLNRCNEVCKTLQFTLQVINLQQTHTHNICIVGTKITTSATVCQRCEPQGQNVSLVFGLVTLGHCSLHLKVLASALYSMHFNYGTQWMLVGWLGFNGIFNII